MCHPLSGHTIVHEKKYTRDRSRVCAAWPLICLGAAAVFFREEVGDFACHYGADHPYRSYDAGVEQCRAVVIVEEQQHGRYK